MTKFDPKPSKTSQLIMILADADAVLDAALAGLEPDPSDAAIQAEIMALILAVSEEIDARVPVRAERTVTGVGAKELQALADRVLAEEGSPDNKWSPRKTEDLARGVLELIADRSHDRELLEKGHAILASILAAFASIGIVAPNGRTAAEDICVLGAKIARLQAEVARWEEIGARHDIKLRDPGCRCHQEEGDSPCPVHPECWCRDCEDHAMADWEPLRRMMGRRFIVCPTCGNKRCPRAKSHDQTCTGSNDPGQPGSDYP